MRCGLPKQGLFVVGTSTHAIKADRFHPSRYDGFGAAGRRPIGLMISIANPPVRASPTDGGFHLPFALNRCIRRERAIDPLSSSLWMAAKQPNEL